MPHLPRNMALALIIMTICFLCLPTLLGQAQGGVDVVVPAPALPPSATPEQLGEPEAALADAGLANLGLASSPVEVIESDNIRLLKVNLQDSRVRVRVVQANNDQGGYQSLYGMKQRFVDAGHAEWAIINGDLFAPGGASTENCAEGLTYIDGQRRDNRAIHGSTWMVRGNIGFSEGRYAQVAVGDGQTQRHMVIAGGPWIAKDGGAPTFSANFVDGKTYMSTGEQFDDDVRSWGTDTRAITMIGYDQNHRTLYMAVSRGGKNVLQVAQWLKERGAYDILRLDSGGSSGMYHNNSLVAGAGSRAIANAIAITVATGEPEVIPSKPSSVNATTNLSDRIRVTWSSSSGATHYDIYRSTSASDINQNLERYNARTGTSFDDTDPNLERDRDYYYRVTACNSHGCSNDPAGDYGTPARGRMSDSSVVTGTSWQASYMRTDTCWNDHTQCNNPTFTESIPYPGGNTIFSKDWGNRSPGSSTPEDYWTGMFQSTVTFPPGYYVFYADHDDGLKMKFGTTEHNKDSAGTNSMLCNGSNGYYVSGATPITLYLREDGGDARLNLRWSTDCTPCQPPAVPTGVNASDDQYTDKVRITWNGSANATRYEVWRATSSGGSKAKLGEPTGTTYDDTSAAVGTTYYYWVKACGNNGCSDFSSYNTGRRASPVVVPSAPANVAASDGDFTDKVRITWSASSGATRYEVWRATSSGGSKTRLGEPTGTTYDDTGAVSGTTYYYWVVACNSAGCSGYSSYNTGYRASPAPTYPLQLYKGAGYADGYCYNTDAGSDNFEEGCTTYDDVVSSLLLADGWSVRVYAGSQWSGVCACLTASDPNLADNTFDDGSAMDNAISSYQLFEQAACPPLPPAPSNVQASQGTYTDYVRVSWNSVAGATHYGVARAPEVGGESIWLGSTTAISHDDTTAEPGVTYRYWVAAYSDVGWGPWCAPVFGRRALAAPPTATATRKPYVYPSATATRPKTPRGWLPLILRNRTTTGGVTPSPTTTRTVTRTPTASGTPSPTATRTADPNVTPAVQTLSRTIIGDAYDGYEDEGWNHSGDGNHNNWVGPTSDVMLGWIFADLQIPRGATITDASVSFRGYGSDGSAAARIQAFDDDDSAPFVTDGSNRPSLRPRTGALVNWPNQWPFAWTLFETPNLAPVIQEVVDRQGWAPGNNMGLVVRNPSGEGVNWSAVDYAGGSGHAVTLQVTFETQGQAAAPSWQILTLIYDRTDFSYTDDQGVARRVVAEMSPAEIARAEQAATRFFTEDVPLLSSGYQRPTLTIRHPSAPLSALGEACGYWPGLASTAADRDPAFDAVVVIWDSSGTDVLSGQPIPLQNCGGLSLPMGTDPTYCTFQVDSVEANQRNVFKHEWGHSIAFYYDAAGTAPKPAVNNHINDTNTRYVNCVTGSTYILQDENDDNLIPNSIYNNLSGFTHDYYSGLTATAEQPGQCLGITAQAWASGGPVSRP